MTQIHCDSNYKYWCLWVEYSPSFGGVYATVRNAEGGRDGGALQWQRFVTQDWRQNPSTGQWSLEASWSPSGWYYNIPNTTTDAVSVTRFISDNALVRLQNRYYEYVPGTGYYYWCSTGYDMWLYTGWGAGEFGGGPC